MAVRLRLRRMGRKKRPFYRIVAADQRSPRDGRFIEKIGYYDPLMNPHEIKLDEDRVYYWLEKGAQPSRTVRNLLQQKGILFRIELSKRGLNEEDTEIEMKKWELLQIERRKRQDAAVVKKKKEKVEKDSDETTEVVESKKEKSEEKVEKGKVEEKTETKTEKNEITEVVEPKKEKSEEKVEKGKVEEKTEAKTKENKIAENNENNQKAEPETESKETESKS